MTAILLAACSGGLTPVDSSGIAPAVSMPHVRIPGLHARNATLDGTTIALEMVHPDEVAATLEQAGLVGVTERTLTGRLGVFSRVVVRGWSFATADGAASFADWLQTNANEMIGDQHDAGRVGRAGRHRAAAQPVGLLPRGGADLPRGLAAGADRVDRLGERRRGFARRRSLALIDSIRKET